MFSNCHKKKDKQLLIICYMDTFTKKVNADNDTRYSRDTDIHTIEYSNNNVRFRGRVREIFSNRYCGPNYIRYHENTLDRVFFENWNFRLNKEKREKNDDCPTFIEYTKTGNIVKETWEDGIIGQDRLKRIMLHRKNGPAIIRYYKNGRIKTESWFLKGVRHRIGGPASVEYNENGFKIVEVWQCDGIKMRKNKPTILRYDEVGHVYKEEWYDDNVLHRENRPAISIFYKNGSLLYREWYNKGKIIAYELENGTIHHYR